MSLSAPEPSGPVVSSGELPGELYDQLLEIVEAVEARRARHPRGENDIVEAEQLVVVRHRLLVMHVERRATEPARAQRFDQRLAVTQSAADNFFFQTSLS